MGASNVANGQINAVSPLTVFGFGDLSEGFYAQNFGMGGTSVALREALYINVANPASYSKLEFATMETALSHRFIEQSVPASNMKLLNQSTYFNYFGLGFKLTEKWGASVNLMPFSFVGYNIFTRDSTPAFGDITYLFEGKGGINQVVIGNAYEIFKNFSVGFNARYLFGSIDQNNSVLLNSALFYSSKRVISTGVSAFALDYGLQYTLPLGNNVDFNLGAVYANQIDLKSVQSTVTYSFYTNNSNEIPVDTIESSLGNKGFVTLPGRYSGGLSIGKRDENMFTYSWMITAEYNQTSWSSYRNFQGEGGLNDSWRASVGGYFTPRAAFRGARKSKSYFSQVEYRFGGFYEETFASLDNVSVLNYGATAGLGFPIGYRNLAPGERKTTVLNFGIVVGNRGNGVPTQVNERYVNLLFGITLGDEWFQKFKYR